MFLHLFLWPIPDLEHPLVKLAYGAAFVMLDGWWMMSVWEVGGVFFFSLAS